MCLLVGNTRYWKIFSAIQFHLPTASMVKKRHFTIIIHKHDSITNNSYLFGWRCRKAHLSQDDRGLRALVLFDTPLWRRRHSARTGASGTKWDVVWLQTIFSLLKCFTATLYCFKQSKHREQVCCVNCVFILCTMELVYQIIWCIGFE